MGTKLSFFGCELKENHDSEGPARLQDAQIAYLNPAHDATCSCTYPRCFNGSLVSESAVTHPNGEGMSLGSWMTGKSQEYIDAVKNSLEKCCQSKNQMYIDEAARPVSQGGCGLNEDELNDLCATDNGYEPRFEGEAQGPSTHFPNNECVAALWSKNELIMIANEDTFSAANEYDEDQISLLNVKQQAGSKIDPAWTGPPDDCPCRFAGALTTTQQTTATEDDLLSLLHIEGKGRAKAGWDCF